MKPQTITVNFKVAFEGEEELLPNIDAMAEKIKELNTHLQAETKLIEEQIRAIPVEEKTLTKIVDLLIHVIADMQREIDELREASTDTAHIRKEREIQ